MGIDVVALFVTCELTSLALVRKVVNHFQVRKAVRDLLVNTGQLYAFGSWIL